MKRALVFGGGGSKGAYEIGVWKALDELGQTFDIVTGTSIGALIGVLYVQHDYEKAQSLWQNLTIDDVMVNGVNLDKNMEVMLSQKGKYADFISNYMHNKGIDISPLEELIKSSFDAEKFFESTIDYGCMTVNLSKLTPQPMRKKDMNKDSIIDYLVASSSCFPAFPMKQIEDDRYIDGGYYDNVPITLARDMGADEIVAVDLKSFGKKLVKTSQNDTLYIEPFIPLGSFLLFEKERIHRNMQLGYHDTMKKFESYIGTIYTFYKNDKESILNFEVQMDNAFQNIDEILNRHKKNPIIEKVVNFKLIDSIEAYKEFNYPYLAMIEEIAYCFEIDYLNVFKFHDFINEILNIANHHVFTLLKSSNKQGSLIDALTSLKEESKIDTICYIYHFLLQLKETQGKEIEVLSILCNDSFIKAYTLYTLQKEAK